MTEISQFVLDNSGTLSTAAYLVALYFAAPSVAMKINVVGKGLRFVAGLLDKVAETPAGVKPKDK